MSSGPESSFANLLRCFRLAAYLTQEDLADRARLSVRAISDLERGVNHAPRNETLALLTKALGLSAEERAAFKAAARGGAVPGAAPYTIIGSAEPPFVGRRDELALLDRHISGQGPPMLVLAGEPGIGKSRLLQLAAVRAPRHGLQVLIAGCRRSGVQTPYSPLLEALQRHLRGLRTKDLTRALHGCAWLVRLLPELRDGPIEPPPAWSLPPEQEKRLMIDAVKQVLANVGGPSGTLLVLDDLQWARTDALDLLATLASPSSEGPLRIVGAYQDTEVKTGDALFHVLADLTRTGSITRHPLGPLAPGESAQLLRELVGTQPTTTLYERTVEQAGGVPFFLVSLAHLLRENPSGGADDDEPRIGKHNMPWTLVETVQQRVAILGEDARELLGGAAVIGRVVPRVLLSRVLGWPESKMLPLLETACGARLLEEKGAHNYQFTHDVIREVLEADLSTARRTILHEKVADALAAGLVEAPVEKVAFHYSQTEDHAGAVWWLERAGDQASAALAHESAVEFYRAAIVRASVDSEGRTALSRLQEKQGDLHRLHLNLDSALAAFAEARAVEAAPARRADLMRKEGVVQAAKGNSAAALAAFAAAEVEGGSGLPPVVRAAVCTDRAFCLYFLGNFASAETEVERAIHLLSDQALSREVDRVLAPAIWVQAIVRDIKGDVVGAHTSMEGLLVNAERLGNQQFVGRALLGLGVCAWREARLDEADAQFRGAQTAVGRVADAEYTAGSSWGLGCVAFLRGDLHAAQLHFRHALETANIGQHLYLVALIWEELGKVACGRGDLEAAEEWFRQSLSMREPIHDQRGIAQSWNGLGMVASARGDHVQAAVRHRNARRLARRCGAFYAEIDAVAGHVRACIQAAVEGQATPRQMRLAATLLARGRLLLEGRKLQGLTIQLTLLSAELQLARHKPSEARQSTLEILPLAERLGLNRMVAAGRLLLGRCASADRDFEEAERQLRSALVLFTKLGCALDAAHTRGLLANVIEVRADGAGRSNRR
jgi:tetratricopeptide (TPR) repeat protein/transcriptional regulator with XRE-family HTH domain